jgi:hypothetical protein
MEKKKREREEESGSSVGDGSLVSTLGQVLHSQSKIHVSMRSVLTIFREILPPVGDHYLIRYLSKC